MEFKVDAAIRKQFRENGFAIIPGFLTPEEVTALKESTKLVVDKYCSDMPATVFADQARDAYFAESGDKIRGFLEEKALDAQGNVVIDTPGGGLNKVGHALHKFEPVFNEITMGSKVQKVLAGVTDMNEPTCIQSMVIFKNPQVGGTVKPHQDSSYMYSEPTPWSLLGFWIALDEATLENGCVRFLPGSHKDGKLYERFVRNPDKTSKQLFVYEGESVPEPPKEKLVPAVCKPGDLVLIDGLVIHQSEPNTSNQPRLAYTFHITDASSSYSPRNWLQPTPENTFMRYTD